MSVDTLLVIGLGALAGGFVSGLAGFGTGITSIGIWLYVLPPPVTATLVVVCSIAAQLQTLPGIWHAVNWRRTTTFIAPGLVGVPFGTLLLAFVDARTFKLGIGCLLLAYAGHALWSGARRAYAWGGRMADGVVGFAGGILGGLAGLSGPLPTMWAALRGWPKDERRAVFQTFNLSMLSAALIGHAAMGLVTRELVGAAIAALPFTFVGAWIGRGFYTRASEQAFADIIAVILALSGVILLATSLA